MWAVKHFETITVIERVLYKCNGLDLSTKVITACRDSPLDSLLRRLALELASLPLLELGGPLAWCGGPPADPCGRLDLSFGCLQIHVEELPSAGG